MIKQILYTKWWIPTLVFILTSSISLYAVIIDDYKLYMLSLELLTIFPLILLSSSIWLLSEKRWLRGGCQFGMLLLGIGCHLMLWDIFSNG